MNVATMQRSIMLCRKAGVTPFVHGHMGIGKSTLIKMLAAANMMGCVDFRVSQIEAADLRGLPAKENGRTVYYPPAQLPTGDITWEQYQGMLKQAGKREWEEYLKLQPRLDKGFLFLDEANRGQDDVSQAIFELVLDGRIGQYALPPGWSVVAAGNFMEGYMVNGFTDPAFISRFCHLTLSVDESEWVNYMELKHTTFKSDNPDPTDLGVNHAGEVIEFAAQNPAHLTGGIKGQLGFDIKPSPRAWDMVANIQTILANDKKDEYGEAAGRAVISGLVGADLATSFFNYNCPVTPDEIITNGVKANIEVLNKIMAMKDGKGRGMIMGLMWGVSSKLRKLITDNPDDDKYMKVAIDFTRFLVTTAKDKDVAVAYCQQMMAGNKAPDQIRSSMLSNAKVIGLVHKWSKKKSFIAKLSEDHELYPLINKASWGSTGT
jgi:hypothetical protein